MSEVEPAVVTRESRSGGDSLTIVSEDLVARGSDSEESGFAASKGVAPPFDADSMAISPAPDAPEEAAAGVGSKPSAKAAEPVGEDYGPKAMSQPVDSPDQRGATEETGLSDMSAAPEISAGSAAAPAPIRTLKSLIESELAALQGYHRRLLESGEVEAIHKMRVITRRLQAAIDLLQCKPDHLKISALKKRLRRWRRSLSGVRNYDVFLVMVEKETQARRPGGRRPYELIGTELEKRRVKSLKKARLELEHIRIEDLAAKLGFVLESAGQPGSAQHEQIAGYLGREGGAALLLIEDEKKIAARAFDRLRQRLAEFQAKALSTHASDKPAEIHRLRIAAKRLRYLIEALSQMGYGDASRAVEWLKATQDRLGDLHDIEAFGEEIVRIAARPAFVRKHMSEAGEMLQAASRSLARRESLRARLLPVRVPPVLGAASARMTRSVSASSIPRDPD